MGQLRREIKIDSMMLVRREKLIKYLDFSTFKASYPTIFLNFSDNILHEALSFMLFPSIFTTHIKGTKNFTFHCVPLALAS